MSLILSVLVSDLNGDGVVEIWIGNDFDEPDVIYSYDLESQEFTEQKEMLPYSTTTTMSMDIEI